MKTDSQIQVDVMNELKWDPSITHENIGVAVKDAIVTLSGYVPSYQEKSSAEKAVQRVAGAKAVVDKIEVKLPGLHTRTDEDIAGAIVSQFRWNVQIPDERIKVAVESGWVNLTGYVDWDFQRTAAEKTARKTIGVRGISNFIEIKPVVKAQDVRTNIVLALKRAAEIDANRIHVDVNGGDVTLSGSVRTFAESNDARLAAFCAPGVTKVMNNIRVSAE
jgi:osmotically-inducible protein OsmY